jgi:predicted transcriptional regulator with HTH domain
MHQDYDNDDLMDRYEALLKALIDLSVLEQLVGEDGLFYYRVTDYGRQFIKGVSNDFKLK